MPTNDSLPNPTPAELEILRVLWKRGPSTVREVQETLSSDKSVGYTTVLKLLQIMMEKRLVDREDAERAHVYWARQTEGQAQTQLVNDLVDRVFGGAAQHMVLHALATRPASAEELAEIRRFLDLLEESKT